MTEISERVTRLMQERLVADSLSHGPFLWTGDLARAGEDMMAAGVNPWNAVQDLFVRWSKKFISDDDYFEECRRAWQASGVDCVSWTIGPIHAQPYSFDGILHNLAVMTRVLDHRHDLLAKVLCAGDMDAAKASGRIGVILNFQDLTPIGERLELIEQFYLFGVRIMQLTLNNRNRIGTGCTEASDEGLTEFGRQVVDRLNDQGVVVDVSHCGPRTSMDAALASRSPIMATHTFARALSDHDRAKDDDFMKTVADRGGYLGVLALAGFLTDKPQTTLDDWLNHVDYMVNLAGVDHVGIGTDYFGHSLPPAVSDKISEFMDALGFRPEHKAGFSERVVGFETYENFPHLVEGLASRGYGDEDMAKLIGGNFRRVFAQVCG